MKLPSKSLAEIRANLLVEVDEQAEKIRLRYLTGGSGQALTYMEKEREARAFQADPSTDLLEVPHVAREATIRGISLEDMAALIIRQADEWRRLSALLESARMGAKLAIQAASTPAAARASATIVWPPITVE